MACEGSSKATINLIFPETKEQIISSNPPVEVSTNYQAGLKKVYITGTAYNSSCTPLPGYEEYMGEIPINTPTSLIMLGGGICPNGRRYDVKNAGSSTGTEWLIGTVSIREIITKKPGCEVTITDTRGRIFQKLYTDKYCPEFTIGCDDGCPPGYLKCDSPNYPGYCCIHCKETASKINNLAAKTRCCHG
ncbi:MAG: hypothetical protein C6Y22_17495 [Hapalosiphonaceae cyanobacterium JJU2]|nr:MAG: hypothetical protein C6Y22_17495 [Hapalosiphonaceae cyanobacterium JJU2]